MGIAEKISPYSVKVVWKKEEVGSGLLVCSINNTYYLFTVRHLFKKGNNTNYKDVTESSIKKELKNISIAKKSFNNNIFVDDFLFFDDTDLLIFSLKLKDEKIQDLPKIKVLKNNHQEEIYFFYGYPNGSENLEKKTTGTIEKAEYSQPSEEEKDFFRLSATKNIDGDAVLGYSGSGIFRVKDKNIYLVGLFSRAKEELSYYECVDLVAIIGDINKKLKERFDDEIEVDGFQLEEKKEDKSSLNNTINKSKNSNQIGDTGNNNIINQSNTTTHHHYGGIFGIIGIVLIVGIYIFYPKSQNEANTSTEIVNINDKKDIINKTKFFLSGEVKNRKENQIYYLYRYGDTDIKTTSELNGSFIFQDISSGHDINDEWICIVCCEDENYDICRQPTECLLKGKSCEIY